MIGSSWLRRSWALALAALACSATLPSPTPGPTAPDPGPTRPADAGPCALTDGGAAGDAGSPALASLVVTAVGSSLSALIPGFAPDVYDYYVQCAAGTNTVTVTSMARPGGLASVALETPSVVGAEMEPIGSPAPGGSGTVRMQEGQALVATAIEGSAQKEYWVRCLPHDVSPMEWNTNADAGSPTPGYYLLGNEQPNHDHAAYALVLDRLGVPVWYHKQSEVAPFQRTTAVLDVDSLAPGDISFIPWPTPEQAGPFEVRTLSPLELGQVASGGWALDPHELRSLSNGDHLLFTNQLQTGVDLTGYKVAEADGGVLAFGPGSTMLPCNILELDPQNRVVWEWIATDHLDPVKDNLLAGLSVGPGGDMVPDPFHCNSIDVDPASGNLLVSSRHMDSVFYIERSTGRILWKMGGVDYTKDGAVYVPVPDPFHLQHDARLLPGWSATCGGQITVFDDQSYGHTPSRAVVYDVSLGGATCPKVTATNAWQQPGIYPSSAEGSFRVLPDGSRVIGWGTGGVAGRVLSEVDAEHNLMIDLFFTDKGASYRAVKVPVCELDIEAMRRTAGLP